MKKFFRVLLILILIGIIFFTVDYIRVKKQKYPIFCLDFGGVFSYQDGGTKVYIGLGYKVIDFHKIIYNESGWNKNDFYYDKIHICSWFKSYDMLVKEIKERSTY